MKLRKPSPIPKGDEEITNLGEETFLEIKTIEAIQKTDEFDFNMFWDLNLNEVMSQMENNQIYSDIDLN